MDVDDVALTGSGTFSISLLYEADYLCSQFPFFSAGQPLVMQLVLLPTDDSGSTHGKFRPVIYEMLCFFDIFMKSCGVTAYCRFCIVNGNFFLESW